MARKKSAIRSALKPAHLQAIGLVAAQWNSLEFFTLWFISKLANIKLGEAIILAAPSNMMGWTQMLQKLARRSEEYSWKTNELKPLCKRMNELQIERNAVVHAFWDKPDYASDLAAIAANITPPRRVTGVGIPKRGLSIFIDIAKSAAEMRDLAKRIEEAESALFSWWAKQQPKTAQERLAQALLPSQSLQTKQTTLHNPPLTLSQIAGLAPVPQKK